MAFNSGSDEGIKYEIIKDFGEFGDGKWVKHLCLVSWNGREPKFDIRPWNEDMSKMSKGITLADSELYDLYLLIEKALNMSDGKKDSGDEDADPDDSEDD